MEKVPVCIERYRMEEFPGYFVDVEECTSPAGQPMENYILGHDDYGLRVEMFGLLTDQREESGFSREEMILKNIEDHVEDYEENYMVESQEVLPAPDAYKENLEEIFQRTENNCRYYEEKKKMNSLLNEIGVLRGISYAMESVGLCPHTEEFLRFIEVQQELKD